MKDIAAIAAAAWDHAMRVTPAAFDDNDELFYALGGGPRRTYAERLVRRRKNCFGDVIQQIELVKANLRRLGKPPRPPRLPA